MSIKHTFEPLAIVGMSCMYPKAQSLEDYWENIKQKVDAIKEVPPTHWRAEDYYNPDKKCPDHVYTTNGGFIEPVDFNPAEWGISPSDLDSIDTAQLLSLVVAQGALSDAGYVKKEFNRDKTSVILGFTATIELAIPLGARLGHPFWRKAMLHAGITPDITDQVVSTLGKAYVSWQENSFPGLLGNVCAGRIANRLNLGGTNCVIDAACASSLSAIDMAALELWTGRSDMAITGGVDAFNDIFMFTCFCKTPALSPTGHARPFSEDNDGTILGEGIGMIVLKRLSDAERDGDKIYALINAIGSSSDGKGKAVYAPAVEGQKKALLRAYEQAGISPQDIGLIEAHGTGTAAGDKVEVTALKEVYGNSEKGKPWCALGSVKSQIGHTKAAAGSANIIKAALSLYHKVIPPTIKISKPAESLKGENIPFYLPDNVRPWITTNGQKRYAAVSSMGFGGSNFHVILSEYDSHKKEADFEKGTELITISAGNTNEIKSKLASYKNIDTADLRRKAAEERKAFNSEDKCRLAFVIEKSTDIEKTISDIEAQLDTCGENGFNLPNGACYAQTKADGPIGILFPGQGSQYPGMLRNVVCSVPEAFETLSEIDSAIGSMDEQGNTLNDYIYPRPNYDAEKDAQNPDKLKATNIAQPAIGAISLGLYKILESYGIEASGFAGHSYGELVGLCAAGAYNTSTLARLSAKRGQLMVQGSGEGDKGGMIAVLGSIEAAEQVVKDENLDLVVANHNSNKQVVFSGKTSEVARAKDIFKAHKMKSTVLNVAGAFHSSFVAKAAEPFSEYLKEEIFAELKKPVYSNTFAEKYPEDIIEVKNILGHQLANRVRFVEIIQKMYADGIRTFIEAGPGSVLTGLMKNILDTTDFKVIAMDSSSGKRSSITDLARALAQLAVMGYKLNLEKWQNGSEWLEKHPETAKPRLTFKLCGANYKSPKQLAVIEELNSPVPTEIAGTIRKAEPVMSHEPVLDEQSKINNEFVQNLVNNYNTLPQSVQRELKNFGIVDSSLPENIQQNQNVVGNQYAQPVVQAQPVVSTMLGDTITALQNMQQQTAELHKKFLEGQNIAQQALMAIISGGAVVPAIQSNVQPVVSAYTTPIAIQNQNVSSPINIQQPTPIQAEQAIAARTQAQESSVFARLTSSPIEEKSDSMRIPKEGPVFYTENFDTVSNAVNSNKSAVTSEKVKSTLLEVVSEKTGYPQEMLNLEMDMEADLGIDSIKRVEIMSAMQEKLPEAPVVQPDQLSKLRTLNQILEYLSAGISENTPKQTVIAKEPAVSKPQTISSANSEHVKTTLLEVVSEKTGYPQDMLNLEMDMEADLGIDSIKRVEIMSAMQEKLPEAPVVQPDQLSKLRTLNQILEYLSAGSESKPTSPTQLTETSQTVKSQGVSVDKVRKTLLEVVSEKTGYPQDMLNLEMDMEADLGIDSIKRVEIMSAMQEKLPEAPIVQPDQLSKLRTLAQIMGYLSEGSESTATAAEVIPAASNTVAVPVQEAKAENDNASDYDSVLLKVVSEKTGYPIEMLSLDMNMEADLGIDSIKRVEILSAFQEARPEAPVVQPSDIGNFQTIGQILDYLHQNTKQTAPNSPLDTEKLQEKPVENANNEEITRTIIKATEIATKPEGEQVLNQNDIFVITNEDKELALAMGKCFEEKGIKAIIKSLNEIVIGDFPAATKGVAIIAPMPEKALNGLWDSNSEEWLKDAFMAIQKIGSVIKQNKGVIATISRMDGKFGLESMTKTTDPVQGGLAGITKTIRYEWPEVTSRAIDVDYRYKETDELAQTLVSELLVKGPMETGISKYSRIKIEEIEAPLSEDTNCPPNFGSNDIIIVTGGARGVTAATALAFAEKYKSTMVLIGRSPMPQAEPSWLEALTKESEIKAAILKNSGKTMLPKELEAEYKSAMANREVLTNLQKIRNTGSEVFYHSANIRNEDDVAKIIEQVRVEAGKEKVISGLIHGAGVLRDKKIEDKTREQISDVIDTKVVGLRNVLKALSQDNLKMMVFFSSFSGRQGRTGQVDYAMANEVLNKVAQKLRYTRSGCHVMAFNWGPWDGGMVNSGLRNVFLNEGIGLIPLQAGAKCPIIELSNPSETAVEIGIMGNVGLSSDPNPTKKFTKVFNFDLNLTETPWLRSHVINGDPVLPMAVAAELMAEAAVLNNIGMEFAGYDDMRILKGVVLKNGKPQTLHVYAGSPISCDNGYKVLCEIRTISGDKEIVNARTEVLLVNKLTSNIPGCQMADAALIYTDSINEAYSNDLFHGEFFKSLTEIEGWSDKGITAKSKTSGVPSDWFAKPPINKFCSDPMSIDAAYQLMILWTTKVCGLPSLPSYAKKFRKYSDISSDTLTISAIAHRKGSMMATADIDFIDDKGKLIARIEGYECTLNESLKDAFKLRNVIGA